MGARGAPSTPPRNKLRGIPARKAFCFLHLSKLFEQFFILFHAHIYYFSIFSITVDSPSFFFFSYILSLLLLRMPSYPLYHAVQIQFVLRHLKTVLLFTKHAAGRIIWVPRAYGNVFSGYFSPDFIRETIGHSSTCP